jgi:hypothetical protein
MASADPFQPNCSEGAPGRHTKFDSPGFFAEPVRTEPREWPMHADHSCETGLIDADLYHACPGCLTSLLVSEGMHDLHPLPDDWWSGRDVGDR